MKSITGEGEQVDKIIDKLEALKQPFKGLPFNIFDKSHKASWDATMEQFHAEVAATEEDCKVFIEESFQKLRSVEGNARLPPSTTPAPSLLLYPDSLPPPPVPTPFAVRVRSRCF